MPCASVTTDFSSVGARVALASIPYNNLGKTEGRGRTGVSSGPRGWKLTPLPPRLAEQAGTPEFNQYYTSHSVTQSFAHHRTTPTTSPTLLITSSPLPSPLIRLCHLAPNLRRISGLISSLNFINASVSIGTSVFICLSITTCACEYPREVIKSPGRMKIRQLNLGKIILGGSLRHAAQQGGIVWSGQASFLPRSLLLSFRTSLP